MIRPAIRCRCIVGVFAGLLCLRTVCSAADAKLDWPQFRGPGGSSRTEAPAPIQFGTEKNVEWSTPIPSGHSSPCIVGDRIFLTATDREARKLSVLCVDRSTGKILWQRDRVVEKLEACHGISNAATATPATDGNAVFAYFSSYGITAYDLDGKELWTRAMPVAVNRMGFGSGTSPIVAGGLVLLDVHAGPDSHFLALRTRDGEVAWKTANPVLNDGWSTPIVWREGDEEVVGVLNASRFIVRRLKDGSEKWWVTGLPNQVCATPAVGDGQIIITGTGVLGERSELIRPPSFADMIAKYDSNKDGKLSTDEIPKTMLAVDRKATDGAGNMPLRQMLGMTGATGPFDQAAWDKMLAQFDEFLNGDFMTTRVMAVKTGGTGDVSKSAVIWSESKGVPEIPSPLLLDGRIYLVKSGGLAICRDAKTGKSVFEERLGAEGGYFASPVAAGGRIYAASDRGTVTVFEAGDALKVLAKNELAEPIMATPAIADGKIYIRTKTKLYAFKS
jgi:outer membrane protein assembly factor BamB